MDRRRLLLGAAALPLAAALPRLEAAGEAVRPVRVLVFGDSLAAGFGLAPEAGFVPALSRWVAARSTWPVRFLNAGLSGDTTYGGRVRIGWALRHDPEAVIVELGGNDMLMRLDPARSAANLGAIIDKAGAGGRPVLLLGIHATGGARYRRRWDAIWPALATRHGVPLVPDLYATIRAHAAEERAAYLQRDGLHASEKGVATMVALAGPAVLELVARAAARRSAAPAAG